MDWKHTVRFHRPLHRASLDSVRDFSGDPGKLELEVGEQVRQPTPDISGAQADGRGQLETNALQPLLEQILAALKSSADLRREQLTALNLAAVEIACTLCERLFVAVDGALRIEMEQFVSEAVARLENNDPVTLRMSPADAARLGENKAAIHDEMQIVADQAFAEGEFDIGNPSFGLRFNWADQLKELRASMIMELVDAED